MSRHGKSTGSSQFPMINQCSDDVVTLRFSVVD